MYASNIRLAMGYLLQGDLAMAQESIDGTPLEDDLHLIYSDCRAIHCMDQAVIITSDGRAHGNWSYGNPRSRTIHDYSADEMFEFAMSRESWR